MTRTQSSFLAARKSSKADAKDHFDPSRRLAFSEPPSRTKNTEDWDESGREDANGYVQSSPSLPHDTNAQMEVLFFLPQEPYNAGANDHLRPRGMHRFDSTTAYSSRASSLLFIGRGCRSTPRPRAVSVLHDSTVSRIQAWPTWTI